MSTRPSKPLIAVIGSLNIDYVTTTPRCPVAGETLTATSLTISAGGKGANQAVGCGKAAFTAPGQQDVEVQMIGAVGEGDVMVEQLLMKTLRASGVGTSGITAIKGDQTGTATIIVETEQGEGENRILVVPGANQNGMLQVDDILERVKAVADGREPDVVIMQGEIPRSTVLSLLEHYNAPASNSKVVFNPAPVFPDGIPVEAMRGLEVLVVNETEAVLLINALKAAGLHSVSVKDERELQSDAMLETIFKIFHEVTQVKTIIITLGSKGACYSTAAGNRRESLPGIKVERVVDTTAAGDTFVGYFAASLARHTASDKNAAEFDMANAIQQANVAAAKCVQKPGAMQSIPFGYE